MTRRALTFVHVDAGGEHYVRLKRPNAVWIALGPGELGELLRLLVFVVEGRQRHLSILPGEVESLVYQRIYRPENLLAPNRNLMRWLDEQAAAEAPA